MNGLDLPGYGDAATWAGVCSPHDPRTTYDDVAFDDAVNQRVAEILARRMSDPAECGEYMQVISAEAWRAIEKCVASDDAIEGMRVMRDAIAAAMRPDARAQAIRELENEE